MSVNTKSGTALSCGQVGENQLYIFLLVLVFRFWIVMFGYRILKTQYLLNNQFYNAFLIVVG